MIGRGTINRINAVGARRQEIQRELASVGQFEGKREQLVDELRTCEAETERLYGELRWERSQAGRPMGAVIPEQTNVIPFERKPYPRHRRRARLQG